MCMSEDYIKQQEAEKEKNLKRNKATFKQAAPKEDDEFELGDQVGLAFRKSALTALNKDQIMYKKMEMHHYVESVREAANREIYDFFEGIDPNTAPKNMKLLYFYFVGSRNLKTEMEAESVQIYKIDQMKP